MSLTSLDDLDYEISEEYLEHPVALAFWQATQRTWRCRCPCQWARCSEIPKNFYDKDDNRVVHEF
jgi:hypothetical protein